MCVVIYSKNEYSNKVRNMNRLLTVVVPIYNVEKYLGECLDSFVNQTELNFTVLLIDDGSKDSSGQIAKEYERKYPTLFKYVYQDNKGLGGARNTGLSLVKTDYVFFFDSDDFCANRTVESIYRMINENSETLDIIFFNPIIFDAGTNSYEKWHDAEYIKQIFGDNKIINPHQTPKLMETEASVCRAIWRTQYLKDINLKFLEHVHWEDVPPHFLLMHSAKKAVFMDYEGAYYYRSNTGTQITAGSGKSRLDMEIIFKNIEPYFKDKSWSKDKKIYMIAFLSNYMFWSIHVIDDEYLSKFIDISHTFFKTIKLSLYLRFFFKTKTCLRNKIMIWFLKSNIHYKSLTNRTKISRKMKFFNRLKGALKR